MERGNLFEDEIPPAEGEEFRELCRCRSVRFERILSSARPDSGAYEQEQDECVLLLRGEAELELGSQRLSLRAGDWLLIPSGVRHRVVSTSEGALWFAVHIDPSG